MPAGRRADVLEPHNVTDPTFLETQSQPAAPPRLGGGGGGGPAPHPGANASTVDYGAELAANTTSRTASQQHRTAPPVPSMPGAGASSSMHGLMPPAPAPAPGPGPGMVLSLPPGMPPPPVPPPGVAPIYPPWPTPQQLGLPGGVALPPPPPPPGVPLPHGMPAGMPSAPQEPAADNDPSPWGSSGANLPPPPPGSMPMHSHGALPFMPPPHPVPNAPRAAAAAPPLAPSRSTSPATTNVSRTAGHRSGVASDVYYAGEDTDDTRSQATTSRRGRSGLSQTYGDAAETHLRQRRSLSKREANQIKVLVHGARDHFVNPPQARPERHAMSTASSRSRALTPAEQKRRERDALADRNRQNVENERRRLQPAQRPKRAVSSQHQQRTPSSARLPRRTYDPNTSVTLKQLKGDVPNLQDALQNGVTPRTLRHGTPTRGQAEEYVPGSTQLSRGVGVRQGGASPGLSSIHHADPSALRGEDANGSYRSGIEDVYKRMRQTYLDFQRNPNAFLDSVGASSPGRNIAAAPSGALPSAPVATQLSSAAATANPSSPEAAPRVSASLLPPSSVGDTKGFSGASSTETVQLRAELARLEKQWEQLSVLREHSVPNQQGGGGDAGTVDWATSTSRFDVEQRLASLHADF